MGGGSHQDVFSSTCPRLYNFKVGIVKIGLLGLALLLGDLRVKQ